MEEYEKVQPPHGVSSAPDTSSMPTKASNNDANTFPYPSQTARLSSYGYYSNLFYGNHFSAFAANIDNEEYNRNYGRLRYVMVNFAGLISKIVADMLFSEPIVVKVPNGDQNWVDAFIYENNLHTQLYESALSNSFYGDGLFKIRTGPRQKGQSNTVIVEEITPTIYFPKINGFNVREVPNEQELAWTFKIGDKTYLRKEIHTPGLIRNECFLMEGDKIREQVDISIIGIDGLLPEVSTGIDRHLLTHTPNWKTGNRFFGISDYYDMDNLFYAVNNRMTKIDNILDKHSDPILMVPPGVLDEKGRVNKKALGVVEIAEGENNKPEYIVWDASLENAFKEIEKIVEFIYLTSEISPDVLGLGEGISDSGRALKFKLMRTIAKVARKKLYYDRAIKDMLYIAQLMAKEHGLSVGGVKLKEEPVVPEIEWSDGLPIDNSEQIQTESIAIDAGITSKKASIMRVYKVDEVAAKKMLKEVKDETTIALPKMNLGYTSDDK